MSKDAISCEEAHDLVAQGDWAFDPAYVEDVKQAVIKRCCSLADCSGWNDLSEHDRTRIVKLNQAFLSLVRRTAEEEKYYWIPSAPKPRHPDPRMELKVGQGKIIKLAPTFRKVSLDTLGVIGTLAVFPRWDVVGCLLAAGIVARPLSEILQALLEAYESLSDPMELAVFESIAHLEGQYSIVNHDAVAAGDHDRAWGLIAPDIEEVADFITCGLRTDLVPPEWGSLDDLTRFAETKRVAEQLRDRDVLRERRGHWSIVL